ncbi:hypothetical protein CHARACLAT_001789 [Characodon lateralis]|uniref:Uncharacterized protein n=1 Tax=Characodon lateralis TaxID=208331 RepID=A0ABU7E9G4_9TELE|nr:hypothetical protein [Characodon lateralis]
MLPSVFPPVRCLDVSSSSDGGDSVSILLPCGASPFRLPPVHSLIFILPSPTFPVALVRQDVGSCSHSTPDYFTQLACCHHCISSKFALPTFLLVSSSGLTRPAFSHICHTHSL